MDEKRPCGLSKIFTRREDARVAEGRMFFPNFIGRGWLPGFDEKCDRIKGSGMEGMFRISPAGIKRAGL